MSHWGHRLTQTLSSKNLSQADAARLALVPLSVMHGWTTGHSPRDLKAVRRLCEHLEISFCWLLTGEDERPPKTEPVIEWSGVAEITIKRLS